MRGSSKWQNVPSTFSSSEKMDVGSESLSLPKFEWSQKEIDSASKHMLIESFESNKLGSGKSKEIEQGQIVDQDQMECQNEENVMIDEEKEIIQYETNSKQLIRQTPATTSRQTFRSFFRSQIPFQPIVNTIQIDGQLQQIRFQVPKQKRNITMKELKDLLVQRCCSKLKDQFGKGQKQKVAQAAYEKAIKQVGKSFMLGKYRYAIQQCVTDILDYRQNFTNLQIVPLKIEAQPIMPVGSPMHLDLLSSLKRNLKKRFIQMVD